MKDYEKHIRHTHADRKGESHCGVKLTQFDWTFLDIDHAFYTLQQEGRLLPCPKCVAAVVEVLNVCDGGDGVECQTEPVHGGE